MTDISAMKNLLNSFRRLRVKGCVRHRMDLKKRYYSSLTIFDQNVQRRRNENFFHSA